jgi:hypothetical protein
LAASLCMTSSHPFHGLATGLPSPKPLPSTFFGIRCCSILTTCPAHISLFKRMYVERATSLYILQISSFYLILHPPLDWVSKYLLKDFPFKGINLICGSLGKSPTLHCHILIYYESVFCIVLLELSSWCHNFWTMARQKK